MNDDEKRAEAEWADASRHLTRQLENEVAEVRVATLDAETDAAAVEQWPWVTASADLRSEPRTQIEGAWFDMCEMDERLSDLEDRVAGRPFEDWRDRMESLVGWTRRSGPLALQSNAAWRIAVVYLEGL